MRLLAIDTASARCSAALLLGDELQVRAVSTARDHAQLILPMVDSLLRESGIGLSQLDGIAFGRGPGSFTGVRVAASVVQGLALGAGLPVLPVSDLRALAGQALRLAREHGRPAGTGSVLACMDARMGEVYWALHPAPDGHVASAFAGEHLTAPEGVAQDAAAGTVVLAAGMALGAYPQIAARLHLVAQDCWPTAEPHALDVARLAAFDLAHGQGWQDASTAQPVYLRDQVVKASYPLIRGL